MKHTHKTLKQQLKRKIFTSSVEPRDFDGREEVQLIDADFVLELLRGLEAQLRQQVSRAKSSGWNKSFIHGYIRAKNEVLGENTK